MSKKKRKKIQHIDYRLFVQQSLRTDFACTEEDIEIIDYALKGMAPRKVAQFMQDFSEGKAELREPIPFLLDMGDGSGPESYTWNTRHPINALMDYLLKEYGKPFGYLYWSAFTSSSYKVFYQFLRLFKRTPMFREDIEALKERNIAETQGGSAS